MVTRILGSPSYAFKRKNGKLTAVAKNEGIVELEHRNRLSLVTALDNVHSDIVRLGQVRCILVDSLEIGTGTIVSRGAF